MNSFNVAECRSFSDLLDKITTLELKVDKEIISEAYTFAEEAHKDRSRENGDKWIIHSLSVASYLAELRLDTVSIVAGLLHDTVEKENVSIDLIDSKFGTDVAFILDGLTKIRNFSKHVENTQVDEDFNELIFQSAEDIRIIMIRLCEKLHNLVSLENLDISTQESAARKSLYVYAPLAEFLGLGALQRELQDRSFYILYPEISRVIQNYISEFYDATGELINEFEEDFKKLVSKYEINFVDLQARQKGIYSAYKKLKRKDLVRDKSAEIVAENLENVKDLYAARIIVNTIEECYIILGLIHSNFETLHDEFVDYIANPKENGYRSIHILFKYKNVILEVQIRTAEMHEYNEYGPASHIAYKLGNTKGVGDNLTWTKDLAKWKDSSQGVSKEDFKVQILKNSIFCFTPKGLVISLPKGSTPIDFAFRVHTALGSRYGGAVVNKKMVAMSHVLETGDVVEIKTTKNINVRLDWLKYSKSRSNRSRIRRLIKLAENN